jgi:hypothetical protein
MFVGSGAALEFARCNSESFSTIAECEIEDGWPFRPHVRQADAAVVVRNSEAVFWARREGRPSIFVDSLAGFWRPDRPIEELAMMSEVLDPLDDSEAWARFQTLPLHDRALAGHVLASRSLALRFPGVDARVGELRRAGCDGVVLCGSAISANDVRTAMRGRSGHRAADLLVNLGGFDNFILHSDRTAGYLRLIERWLIHYMEHASGCREVLVCGGPYSRRRVLKVGNGTIEFTVLPRHEVIGAMAASAGYLCIPGLTSIQEAIAVGRVPFLLPPQHFGHWVNFQGLRSVGLGWLGVDFAYDQAGPLVGAGDIEGSTAIILEAGRVLDDPAAFRWLCEELDCLADKSRVVSQIGQAAAVRKLLSLVDGPAFEATLATALDDVMECGR